MGGFIYNYSNSYVTATIETETKKIGLNSKQKGLNALLVNQLEQKLSYLASRETNLSSQVQENASKHIVEGIQSLFTGDNKKKKKIKDKFFEENLAKLERI